MQKIPLIVRLVVAIATGLLLGMGLKAIAVEGSMVSAIPIQFLATFNGLFSNFLKFIIPLLILAFVSVGIGELGRGAGKMLGFSVFFAYMSTVIAALIAYAVGAYAVPSFLGGNNINILHIENAEEFLLDGFFNVAMPPVFDVMTALILAFVLGLGIASLGERGSLYEGLSTFQKIIEKVIGNIIIPLLPIHIAGIFANMAYSGKAIEVMGMMFKVFVLILLLHWVILTLLFLISGGVSHKNPIQLLKNMIPAYFTAIGTQSSAATMPITREQTMKNGVSEEVANFVVPLFATIHMPGSVITLTICTIAVSTLMGHPIAPGQMIGFIFMMGIMMVAAPGVPGGAVMAALGVLESIMHFNPIMLSLMIALYLAQDSFGTAANVTGDGALASIIDKIHQKDQASKKKIS